MGGARSHPCCWSAERGACGCYRQIETVFRNAPRLTKDPGIALRAGRRIHVTTYGMYGYAILSSPTVADSIVFSIRCQRITGPVADMVFSIDGAAGVRAYEPLLWPDPTQAYRKL